MINSTPVLMAPQHHSVSDWDFEYGTWELNADQFISPPTSLRLTSPSGTGVYHAVLCRHATVQELDEGYLEAFFRTTTILDSRPCFFIRNHQPLGTAHRYNGYMMYFGGGTCDWFFYTAAGVRTQMGSVSFGVDNHVWYGVRFKWWNGTNPTDDPATVMEISKWAAGTWSDPTTLYDNAENNKGPGINRVGVGGWIKSGRYTYHDDTKIMYP